MESVVKQRLVGSLVLLALAVVFWPIIFVEPKSDLPLVIEPMPERPRVDTSPIGPVPSPRDAFDESVVAPHVDPALQARADADTRLPALAADQTSDDGSDTPLAMAQLPDADTLDPPTPRSTAPTVEPLDERGFVQGWVLQVAAVTTQKRADLLISQLKNRGYEAFARRILRDGAPLWRVQIGPKLEREKLITIKPAIDKAFGVKAAILRYEQ